MDVSWNASFSPGTTKRPSPSLDAARQIPRNAAVRAAGTHFCRQESTIADRLMTLRIAVLRLHLGGFVLSTDNLIQNFMRFCVIIQNKTRMWASAERDGRHDEYRWRPLFNAAKFG